MMWPFGRRNSVSVAPKPPLDNFDREMRFTLSGGREVVVSAHQGVSYDWITIRDAATGDVIRDQPARCLYDLRFCLKVDFENALRNFVKSYEDYLKSWEAGP